MLRLLLSILCFLIVTPGIEARAESRLVAVDLADISVCTGSAMPTDFQAADCIQTDFAHADPQNKQIWVKTLLTVPASWLDESKPLGFFIFGKTSSEIYFNGQRLGQNGVPGQTADTETPGKMDVTFNVPLPLLKQENEVVLNLSSHHGYLDLSRPIHFVGIGDYGAPQALFSHYMLITIALLGAMALGTFYFGILSLLPDRRSDSLYFFLMGLFASTQLFAELSRSLFAYLYPIHDIRLIVIVVCSFGFGFCLLAYIANKHANQNAKQQVWIWLAAGGVATVLAVYLIQGFDAKTTVAILVPALCSTLLISVKIFQERGEMQQREVWGYLFALVLFNGTVLLTLNVFHNLTFYLIITGMIAYLFAQQARALTRERKQRHEEEQRAAKLSFKLDQIEQQVTPTNLTLTNSGEVIHISTDLIRYCKASGDYVELHLKDNRQQLYSGSLKSMEDRLPSTFLKVHRSYIVNLEQVSKLVSSSQTKSGGSCLILSDNTEIPVSRRVMPMVRRAFSNA
ncbi:MAG: hypothetical protein ACI82A_004392 [Candidatus Azotimanducaceae bacterium]|jgi:hypothetical protein